MIDDPAVLVVGAGPTGLLLACELHRRGIGCRIIDDHAAPLSWDRATVVHPRSLEIFDAIGIAGPLLAAGARQRVIRLHASGTVLGEVDLATCGSRFGFNIGISEEVVESLLAGYLRQQGGAEVVRSARLVGLEEREDGILATLERGGATERLSVRWVVACDGLHSAARTLSRIDLAGLDIPEPWAVFDATLPGWPGSHEGNFCFLDAIPVILTALPERRWRVYLRPSASDSDLPDDAAATLRRYFPDLAFADVATPTRFHCHSKVATKFRAGRVLLAGDAAHVCTPAQGHGMNTGLGDAFNLGWKLALVCDGHCSPALLDSYEAERRPVAKAITASGDTAELAQTEADPARLRARDAQIRAAFADPATARAEAVAESELDVDYAASPIVMGDRNDALSPGQLLPDGIAIRLPDGTTSWLHELTDRAGHTALLIDGTAVDDGELAQLERAIAASGTPVVDAVVGLTAGAGEAGPRAWLGSEAAARLGVDAITLLVIRPDGHVGLRADRDHLAALGAYRAALRTGGAGPATPPPTPSRKEREDELGNPPSPCGRVGRGGTHQPLPS